MGGDNAVVPSRFDCQREPSSRFTVKLGMLFKSFWSAVSFFPRRQHELHQRKSAFCII